MGVTFLGGYNTFLGGYISKSSAENLYATRAGHDISSRDIQEPPNIAPNDISSRGIQKPPTTSPRLNQPPTIYPHVLAADHIPTS